MTKSITWSAVDLGSFRNSSKLQEFVLACEVMFASMIIDGNEINANSRVKITTFKKSNHFRKIKNDNTPFPK